MIKVSVMYPYAAGARFDHVYYRERHMPMVKQRLGAACLYYTVDKAIAGGAPPARAGDQGRHRKLHGYKTLAADLLLPAMRDCLNYYSRGCLDAELVIRAQSDVRADV